MLVDLLKGLTSKTGVGLLFIIGLCSGLPPAFAAVGDIGTFTSSVKTFSTASYWIEGDSGVIMIDTQFLPKEALEASLAAEKATGKKVVAAIVLHPNPDKFNGTAILQARGIQVLTTRQIKDEIPAVHKIRLGWFFDEYAPDYPKEAANPDVIAFAKGEIKKSMSIAGINLTLHALGAGASKAHLVVQHGSNVFVGDLINPSNHAWLELGTIKPWLRRLDEIAAMDPNSIYPGRGPKGGVELVAQQKAYLTKVSQWVGEEIRRSGGGSMGFFAKRRLQSRIEDAYPALGYPIFMRDGLQAVWTEEMK
jgi:glyoxylase-like metal-dependent hydrolase (beta-lactamase superfamily II)